MFSFVSFFILRLFFGMLHAVKKFGRLSESAFRVRGGGFLPDGETEHVYDKQYGQKNFSWGVERLCQKN